MAIGAYNLDGVAWRIAANASLAAPGGTGVAISSHWPEWIQLALMLAGVVTGIGIIQAIISLRNRFPEPETFGETELVRMLCDQVWGCTNRLTTVFAQRLRQPPGDIVAMRILVRHLREDLSVPVNFIEQMRAHPPGAWYGTSIFKSFTNWSAEIAAMSKQLDDLHQAITYPLIREPVDKQRDAMLVYQYLTEQAFLNRRVEDVLGRAYEFCDVARKILKKASRNSKSRGDADEGKHDCPCCKRPPEQHRYSASDPLQPIVLPPPPAPPPSPAPPPPANCHCAVPRACHCSRGCACFCQCAPALPALKAAT